ncbi:hypothetical protein ANN_10238 [Periplaneta americana]|uniref:LRRCT domain-containing protein n=1 Tax=Periplaneta americana TaxID=6978 RepID=A0ABQ8TNH0_PERAM|nr:hypothetical protein ANN_10238 [Periplaneta americana]
MPVPVLVLLLLAMAAAAGEAPVWRCPDISQPPMASCSCDLPHTLRCTGDSSALSVIADVLRDLQPPATVSLLDCAVRNVSTLDEPVLEGVRLHGLVVSSGELRRVGPRVFAGLGGPLQALGLPNNRLATVPTAALAALPALDRLDLSHNRLDALRAGTFRGLRNLTFLELSDNALSAVEARALVALPRLRTLRLRGNRLTVEAAAEALQGAGRALQELDLSGNMLAGPLGATTLPALAGLRVLALGRNRLSSVRRGALDGCGALVSLSLQHNQIDVLEDDAFAALRALTQLDLAHNRIVAVSGGSLAHLSRLVQLDLAHNFLRALTADLVAPLRNLQELRLDDNDISMVSSEALPPLRRLTLADNPLNCDCSLAEFAAWLANCTRLPASDRSTAVCATPPSLENGLLAEVSPHELLCGDDDDEDDETPSPSPTKVPVSGKQVALRAFEYDGFSITLRWGVEASAAPYACDALFVYEEVGAHEVLLESSPVHCNSSQLPDPRALTVSLSAADLMLGHRYRYCVVLMGGGGPVTDEVALVLGCSDVIPLVPTGRAPPPPPSARVASLHANVTAPGTVQVAATLWEPSPRCLLTVAVFAGGALVAQERLNCSQPRALLRDLPAGPYRVCASAGDSPARCVSAQAQIAQQQGLGMAIAAGFAALSSALLLGLFLAARRLLRRPKLMPTHQCFLAGPPDEAQHARYVKLHATTKL